MSVHFPPSIIDLIEDRSDRLLVDQISSIDDRYLAPNNTLFFFHRVVQALSKSMFSSVSIGLVPPASDPLSQDMLIAIQHKVTPPEKQGVYALDVFHFGGSTLGQCTCGALRSLFFGCGQYLLDIPAAPVELTSQLSPLLAAAPDASPFR